MLFLKESIMDIEFEQYLENPGDTELAALFREIKASDKRFDALLEKARRLGREVSEMARSVDLGCVEFIYELHHDSE